jgi:arsenate reductase (glutaredoxin)
MFHINSVGASGMMAGLREIVDRARGYVNQALGIHRGEHATLASRAIVNEKAPPLMTVTLYHNPMCSKSRETLALLREHGVEPQVIEYLKTPPNVTELDAILTMLGIEPRALMRTKDAVYETAGLSDLSLTREQLIARMVANPSVIERPIVVNGQRAAMGRPPEAVLTIL